jgi:hypothetical protein
MPTTRRRPVEVDQVMTLGSLQREARRLNLDLSSMNVVKATAAAAAALDDPNHPSSPPPPSKSPFSQAQSTPPLLQSRGLLRSPSFCSAQVAHDEASRARRQWQQTGVLEAGFNSAADQETAAATSGSGAVSAPTTEATRDQVGGGSHNELEGNDVSADRCDSFGATPHGRQVGSTQQKALGDPMDDWIETPDKDWWRSTGF